MDGLISFVGQHHNIRFEPFKKEAGEAGQTLILLLFY
jgi:hypothetical protein